jgi:hypothetical protein
MMPVIFRYLLSMSISFSLEIKLPK